MEPCASLDPLERGIQAKEPNPSMTPPELSDPGQASTADKQKAELRAFLFLTVVMAPLLAGLIVAGYGFAVWMLQLLAGPPGPG